MTRTAAVLSDITLAASGHVRAGRAGTVADLVAGRAPNFVIAHKAIRTLDNFREAHAALGADRLATALGTLSAPAIRAVLRRLSNLPPRTLAGLAARAAWAAGSEDELVMEAVLHQVAAFSLAA